MRVANTKANSATEHLEDGEAERESLLVRRPKQVQVEVDHGEVVRRLKLVRGRIISEMKMRSELVIMLKEKEQWHTWVCGGEGTGQCQTAAGGKW